MFVCDNRFKVFLTRNYPSFEIVNNSIYLVKNAWDDYGYKLSYLVVIDYNGNRLTLDQVKIGTDNDSDLDEFITNNNRLPDNAFSLGQTEDYYNKLLSLDKNSRISFLKAMMDIAYDEKIRIKALSTDAYKYSLSRFVNSKTVIDVFAPLSHGRTSDKILSFSYSFPIEYKCEKNIEFKINVANDINNTFAIIGSNGAGKTTFIKDLIQNIYCYENERRRVRFSDGIDNSKLNMIINVSYTGFDRYDEFDSRIEEFSNKVANFPLYNSFNLENSKDKLSLHFLNLLSSSEKILKLKEYLEVFIESGFFNNSILDIINELDTFSDSKFKSYVTNQIINEYEKLSSGQKFIFSVTVQITSVITSRSLILIDEPENHMHPPLLSLFVNILSLIAQNNDSMLIMATHSPIVLQEITSDKIFHIRRDGNFVSFSSPDFETYGSSYGMILNFVFGDEIVKTGFYKKLSSYVDNGMDYNEILSALDNKLGEYGKSLLLVLLNNRNEKN